MTASLKQNTTELEKEHVEVQSISSKDPNDLVGEPDQGHGDYSGASEKTDPSEIKLVRKIDQRLIVSLSTQLDRFTSS